VLSYPFILVHQIPLIRKMATRKTVSDVSADLREHEAKCEERWKTIFARMKDQEEQLKRMENILIGTAAAVICGGGSVIVTMIMMHGG